MKWILSGTGIHTTEYPFKFSRKPIQEREMDHVVYVDFKERELEKILNGQKWMIIRGAAGRKMPYGRVHQGDALYLINNDGSGLIQAKAEVSRVIQSEKMTKEESSEFVMGFQEQLQLTKNQFNRWAGKRYIVLVEIEQTKEVTPFKIDRSNFGNMDDWLMVGKIGDVKI
jgi:hypothetical protein